MLAVCNKVAPAFGLVSLSQYCMCTVFQGIDTDVLKEVRDVYFEFVRS